MKSLPFALVFLAAAACAQPSETFDVASVKLGDPLSPGTTFYFMPGAGVRIENASLKSLILSAYDLREYQLAGAAGWMDSERYTIIAKGTLPEGPADFRNMNDRQRKASSALVRARLRNLLAERFHLVVHKESKELPVYALVVAKGGVKMTANTAPDGSPNGIMIGRAMFKATRASMEAIVQSLSSVVGRPVRDETGLSGFYDVKLEWTPDAAPSTAAAAERPPETFGPTLFTALQEQLGLKLESKKGAVETVVIDRAERPTEN